MLNRSLDGLFSISTIIYWPGRDFPAQTLLSQHLVPAPVNNERETAGRREQKCSVAEAGVWHAELGPLFLAEAVLGWPSAQLLYYQRGTKDCAGPRPWHGFRGAVGLDMPFSPKL